MNSTYTAETFQWFISRIVQKNFVDSKRNEFVLLFYFSLISTVRSVYAVRGV